MLLYFFGRNYIISYKKLLYIIWQGESYYFFVDILWLFVVLIFIGFVMEDWFICVKIVSFLKKVMFCVCVYCQSDL